MVPVIGVGSSPKYLLTYNGEDNDNPSNDVDTDNHRTDYIGNNDDNHGGGGDDDSNDVDLCKVANSFFSFNDRLLKKNSRSSSISFFTMKSWLNEEVLFFLTRSGPIQALVPLT